MADRAMTIRIETGKISIECDLAGDIGSDDVMDTLLELDTIIRSATYKRLASAANSTYSEIDRRIEEIKDLDQSIRTITLTQITKKIFDGMLSYRGETDAVGLKTYGLYIPDDRIDELCKVAGLKEPPATGEKPPHKPVAVKVARKDNKWELVEIIG